MPFLDHQDPVPFLAPNAERDERVLAILSLYRLGSRKGVERGKGVATTHAIAISVEA
jgi:hypothetical protein